MIDIKNEPELRHVLAHMFYAIDALYTPDADGLPCFAASKAELDSVRELVFWGDDSYPAVDRDLRERAQRAGQETPVVEEQEVLQGEEELQGEEVLQGQAELQGQEVASAFSLSAENARIRRELEKLQLENSGLRDMVARLEDAGADAAPPPVTLLPDPVACANCGHIDGSHAIGCTSAAADSA